MTTPKPCPFCGRYWNNNPNCPAIIHSPECYLFRTTGITYFITMPDIDAWNRRYTDAVATDACKVTKEVRE